jgi:hypothetical protein
VNSRRIGCFAFLAAGLYGLVMSLQLPMGKWTEPGAGAFPLIVSLLLCLAAGFIFIRAKAPEEADWRDVLRRQRTPCQIVLFTAGFIAALEGLGYLLSASLYAFAQLYWISRYRFWAALGLALALGGGSWLLFGKVFATPLPTGVMPF